MKRLSMICLFLLVWAGTMFAQTLKSPDGNLTLQFRLSAEGLAIQRKRCHQGEQVGIQRASRLSIRPQLYGDRHTNFGKQHYLEARMGTIQ